jgi:molecular chaperone DnaK
MSDKPPSVFGIDLGTTYSCIAHVDEFNRAVVIPNSSGERITPSVIQFSGEERIVGIEAKNNAVLFPDETIDMVKREMGKKDSRYEIAGVFYTPEEISSYIVRKVVQDAEQYTGQAIKDVVITCPAYFGIPEREATAEAGKIAGLNVLSIINEPTAAAIAYGVNEGSDQVVLVYDLGGGTFDITMIKIEDGNITVICTDGDDHLGGRNWDEIIVNYMAEQWQDQTGSTEDPRDSTETLQDMFIRAEQAKKTLSQREKTDIPIIHECQRARVTLTLEKFDELTANLLDRTIVKTHFVLDEAKGRGIDKFDKLLLVGGATRMKQISQRVGAEFDCEPQLFEPDEAVSKGAAIFGQKLALDQEIKINIAEQLEKDGAAPVNVDEIVLDDTEPSVVALAQKKVAEERGIKVGDVQEQTKTTIINVTSRSFGVIAWDSSKDREIVSNLVKRNDALPVDVTQTFGTMEANQRIAEIHIADNLTGEAECEVSMSRVIGQVDMELPPGLPASSPIEITFSLNEQGRLVMKAKEMTTGKDVATELQTEAGSSVEDIEAAKQRATGIVVS